MTRFPHDALRAEVSPFEDAGAVWTHASLLLVRTAVNAMTQDIPGDLQQGNTARQD